MIAIIFGITGQDGSYLAEYLLHKGYAVIGVCRRASVDTTWRLDGARSFHDFRLVEGDITDESSVNQIISSHADAHEIYNLAAQSHVQTSFDQPHYTFKTDTIGVMNILEAIRRWNPVAKFYQASTSEMFGNNFSTLTPSQYSSAPPQLFQNEDTPFEPTSPYAIAKLAAHYLVKMYRQAYHIFACSGILFNHESERRGESFVTRKITRYVGWLYNKIENMPESDRKYLENLQYVIKTSEKLHLGNLDARRDWGYAPDYVEAMWLMLQQEKPKDYVIATGVSHSVAEFCELAFKHIGISNWRRFIHINENFLRPSDVDFLCGDAIRAYKELGWAPSFSFEDLVDRMVESDIEGMGGKLCPTVV